ncbi:hypothetical protein OOT46_22880 [Aquabacterium sp. A7-Y]|uniref:FitA-like ribbon-helix-helix domain-containing protein n=1 Tax=Aquabacterium sp. A7-Y TaxID=1349605 RepID=UPI00223E1A17|nr:hypothetical protein [Aquabacterium sp. A7-Y]MCW7540668.1 hypothetical protein [Aquabacterium sp. A7-Y]
MFGKLSVRNIPDQIFRALESMAEQHDRSTEAEARQAIRAWVEPSLVEETRNNRRREISERLNRMLRQVNSDRPSKLLPSHIAEAIGEERAEEVEDWFLGEREPSFAQLSAIAKLLGVDAKWLKHGDARLYPCEYHRLSEDPFAAVDWLLTWTPPSEWADGKLTRLHLVRAEDKAGNLYIVKESDHGHFLTFYTPIHVSEEIGAGGEAMLAALFVTLELLYRRYTKLDINVLGHQLHPDDIAQLTSGNTNPGSLLKEGGRSTWWEDIWDREMVSKREYWPGWHSLCDRIEGVISERKRLNTLRTLIRRGVITKPRESDLDAETGATGEVSEPTA